MYNLFKLFYKSLTEKKIAYSYGGIDNLVRNVQICNMSREVKVLSTYSASRFIRSFGCPKHSQIQNA